MEATHALTAKRQMLLLMQAGMSWQEAANHVGIQTSRSTAYRWLAAFRIRGDEALRDGRHGHPAKLREPVLKSLEERCRSHPQMASTHLQAELQEHFGVTISITHLNRVRAASGLSKQAVRRKKRVLLVFTPALLRTRWRRGIASPRSGALDRPDYRVRTSALSHSCSRTFTSGSPFVDISSDAPAHLVVFRGC